MRIEEAKSIDIERYGQIPGLLVKRQISADGCIFPGAAYRSTVRHLPKLQRSVVAARGDPVPGLVEASIHDIGRMGQFGDQCSAAIIPDFGTRRE